MHRQETVIILVDTISDNEAKFDSIFCFQFYIAPSGVIVIFRTHVPFDIFFTPSSPCMIEKMLFWDQIFAWKNLIELKFLGSLNPKIAFLAVDLRMYVCVFLFSA